MTRTAAPARRRKKARPAIAFNGEPDCPRCKKPTFSLEHKEVNPKTGVASYSTLYWCNNSACDVGEDGKWRGGYFYTSEEIEELTNADGVETGS